MPIAFQHPSCWVYLLLLMWCVSSGCVFWMHFKQHWDDAFHGMGHQLLLLKGVAQDGLCAGGASSEIPFKFAGRAMCLIAALLAAGGQLVVRSVQIQRAPYFGP